MPHALWLISSDDNNCQCHECIKRGARTRKAHKPRRNGERQEPPDISAQNAAILHAFLGKLDIRIQEVVWVHLQESVSLSTGESDSETLSVSFWPAVVSSVDCDDGIASVTFLGMSKTQALSTSRLLPYYAYETPTVITSKLPSVESLGSSTSGSYLKALRHCREIEKTYCISSDSSELRVWIGPELVCAGDFVFIKVSRSDLPINRAILAPSGPGFSMQGLLSKSLSNPAALDGVGSLDPDRGVLLGVTSFVVEDEVNAGSSTGVFVKGILYEFADDDWIENTDQSPSSNADISNWNNSQLKIVESGESGEIEAPVPPAGLQLRQILSPGYQALATLQYVKSRYYPCITSHPLLCDAKSRPLCYGGLKQELRQIPSRKDVIDKATC